MRSYKLALDSYPFFVAFGFFNIYTELLLAFLELGIVNDQQKRATYCPQVNYTHFTIIAYLDCRGVAQVISAHPKHVVQMSKRLISSPFYHQSGVMSTSKTRRHRRI